jgi:hypothetical protein
MYNSPQQHRRFWKLNARRSVPKHVQPVVEQVKPIIDETLKEVYKPLLEKLTSIDNKLENIEKHLINKNSDKDIQMVDIKDLGRD